MKKSLEKLVKKANASGTLAKFLAATVLGVGFVAPLTFANIVQAADIGKGTPVSQNTITISESEYTFGGVGGKTGSGTIDDGDSIYGGYSDYGTSGEDSEVHHNVVTISDSSVTLAAIYGGYVSGKESSASFNNVSIDYGTLGGDVYGGYASGEKSNASSNEVSISGGTFDKDVYGGYVSGKESNASSNKVSIDYDTFEGDVYGGYASGEKSNSSSNEVSISDGTFTGKIYGGYSEEGNAQNNTVKLGGGDLSEAEIYGGYAPEGTSSGNTLKIDGIDISVKSVNNFQNYTFKLSEKVAFGDTMLTTSATSGIDFKNNTFTLVIDPNFDLSDTEQPVILLDYGTDLSTLGIDWATKVSKSFSNDKGVVSVNDDGDLIFTLGSTPLVLDVIPTATSDNEVVVTSATTATINGDAADCDATHWRNVYGGYSELSEGVVNGNTIDLSGSISLYSVYGGFGNSAANNKILFSGGTFTGSESKIHGGNSSNGSAMNNSVNISDGTLENISDIKGGYTEYGNAINNKVLISGGKITHDNDLVSLDGGYSSYGYAEGNSVEISGTATLANVNEIYGGSSYSCYATSNKITVSGGEITGDIYGMKLYGGLSSDGSAEENSVEISGTATLTNVWEIYGGLGSSDVTGNKILITGGVITGYEDGMTLYAGYSYGSATGNSVEISGDSELTKTNAVYGGYACSGDAEGNSVIISTGTYNAAIYGGYSEEGNAKNNTVTLNGGTFKDSNDNYVDIYGGYSSEGTSSGNTLEIGGKNISVNSVNDFQNYTFNIPAGMEASDAMLNITGPGNSITIDSNNTLTINPGVMTVGGTITLIDADAAITFTLTSWNCGQEGNSYDTTVKVDANDSTKLIFIFNSITNYTNVIPGATSGNTVVVSSANSATVNGEEVTYIVDSTAAAGPWKSIYGGFSQDDGALVTNNTVTFQDGAKFVGTNNVNTGLLGGSSYNGFATYNKLYVNGGTLDGTGNTYYIVGGYGKIGANYNEVHIGSNFQQTRTNSKLYIYGGYSNNDSDTDNVDVANYNILEITGGTFANVQRVIAGEGYGGADHNTLTITGGSMTGLQYVVAGYSDQGDASNNTLSISGDYVGTVAGYYGVSVAGGVAFGSGGSADNNTVTISSGTYSAAVAGGYVYGTSGISASNNTVTIQGGSFSDEVAGGYVKSSTASTNGNGNTLTINDGVFEKTVYAVRVQGGTTNDNTLNINGGTFKSSVYAYSGSTCNNNVLNLAGGTITGYGITANTINISGTGAVLAYTGGTATVQSDGAVNLEGTLTLGAGATKSNVKIKNGVSVGANKTGSLVGGSTGNISTLCTQWYLPNRPSYDFYLSGTLNISNLVVTNCYTKVSGAASITLDDTAEWHFSGISYDSGEGKTLSVANNGGLMEVKSAKNVTITSLTGSEGAESYVFTLPSGIANGNTVLTITNSGFALNSGDSITVSGSVTLADGQYITLIASEDVLSLKDVSVTLPSDNLRIALFDNGTDVVLYAPIYDLIPATYTDNTVEVTSATTGTVTNNSQATAHICTESAWRNAYGGYSNTANAVVKGNTITISGTAQLTGNVYGGYSGSGVAGGTSTTDPGNTVIVTGAETGNITAIYGGKGADGAHYNTVTVDSSYTGTVAGVEDWMTFNRSVVGGYADGGSTVHNATHNKVSLAGGTYTQAVYGGWTVQSTSVADDNEVEISGNAKVSNVVAGGAYGAKSNNKVTILGGTVTGSIYGGTDANGYGSGNTYNNSVVISAGNVDPSYNITICGGSSNDIDAVSNKNSVVISGTAVVGNSTNKVSIYGGRSDRGSITSNVVEISGGKLTNVWFVQGAAGKTSANSNEITITAGEITGIDEGMSINGASTSGSGENNKVTITGGTLSKIMSITGVWASTGATGNSVVISSPDMGEVFGETDSTYYPNGLAVVGGMVQGSGNANGNSVSISTGTYDKNIYGGYAVAGNAQSNTVILNGGTFANTVGIYGGYSGNSGDATTGNTLCIGGKNISISSVNNFQNYTFTLPADVESGDTMLKITGDTALAFNSTDVFTVNVTNAVSTLAIADVITLIDATTAMTGFGDVATKQILNGGENWTEGKITATDDNKKILFTVTGIKYVDVIPAAVTGNTVTVTSGKEATIKNGDTTTTVKYNDGEGTSTSQDGPWHDVYGGYSTETGAVVKGNSVTVSEAGNLTGDIYGGYSKSGVAGGTSTTDPGNTVTVAGAEMGNITAIYGGYGADGAHYNTVTVDSSYTGTVAGETISYDTQASVVGGYANGGSTVHNATYNKVSLAGGTYTQTVYGGWTVQSTSVADGNEVEISGNAKVGNVVAGGAYGDRKNNKVTILGGTVTGNIYGGTDANGYSGGSTYNNSVVISAGKVDPKSGIYIYGGYSSYGNVVSDKNSVEISGTAVVGNDTYTTTIYGGCSSYGSAGSTDDDGGNMVTIKGGTLTNVNYVEGAFAGNDATKNKLLISDGFIKGVSGGMWLYGGDSNAVSSYNEVTISGGTLKNIGGIDGAFGRNAAKNNKILITGGYMEGINSGLTLDGGYSYNGSGMTADSNVVSIGNGVLKDVKYIEGAYGDKAATNNKLLISGGSITGITDGMSLYGGYSYVGSADSNSLEISGGTLTNVRRIKGAGYGETSANSNKVLISAGSISGVTSGMLVVGGEGYAAVANSNTVEITGGVIENVRAVVGGWGGSSGASNNIVKITSSGMGTVTGYTCDSPSYHFSVAGGMAESTTSGDANGNSVTISSGTYNDDIYGGYAYSGNAENNSIAISGGTFYGDICAGSGTSTSGNTISITGTGATYLGASGTMTADSAATLGNGTDTTTFTVGNGTATSALTFASGLDAKVNSTLDILTGSNVTLQGTSTLAGAVSGEGSLKNTGTLTAALSNLGGNFTNDAGGTLNLNGQLTGNIKGAGTTILGEDQTINTDRQVEGILKANGQTIDMTGGSVDNQYSTLTIGKLAGTADLKIDLDMSNTANVDKLSIGAVESVAILNLSDINITKDYVVTGGGTITVPTDVKNGVTYVTGDGAASGNLTYKINGKAATEAGSSLQRSIASSKYVYTFTLGDAGKLNYSLTTAPDNIFKNFIEGKLTDVPKTLSVTEDTADADASMANNTTYDTLNIYVNDGKKLGSAVGNTVALADGDTINLNGGTSAAGIIYTSWNVAKGGTLNLSGMIDEQGVITNAGTLNLNSEYANTTAIINSGTLNVTAANLKADVTNTNGTVNLGAGELTKVITEGTLNITQDAAVTTSADNLKVAAVTNNGSIALTGGSLTVALAGTLSNSGELTTAAGNLDGALTNTGTVKITGGLLSQAITGGNVKVQGEVVTAGDNLVNTAVTAVSGGELTLVGGTYTGTLAADAGAINLALEDYSGITSLSVKNSGGINVTTGTHTDATTVAKLTEGKLTLTGTATYSTTVGKVFAEDDATGEETGGFSSNNKFNYVAGTLELTDPSYSIDYLNSAIATLKGEISSTTTIVKMTGTLKEESISTEQASKLGENVELPTATVAVPKEKKNTIIGTDTNENVSVEGVGTITDKHKEGFSSNRLDLSKDSTGVVITSDKKVVLGGNGDAEQGNLVTVDGEDVKVNVIVGTTEEVEGAEAGKKNGTLGIGIEGSINEKGYKLNADVTVNEGSKVEVNGNTEITGKVTLSQAVLETADGATTKIAQDLEVSQESTILGNTEVAGSLVGGDDAAIQVGDVTGKGVLSAEEIKMRSRRSKGVVFADPAWKSVGENDIKEASNVATNSVDLDASYIAGQNSVIAFGTTNSQDAIDAFNESGLKWGNGEGMITAAIYINQPVSLVHEEGAYEYVGDIMADGSREANPGPQANSRLNFAANSLLMVNGNICLNEPSNAAIQNVEIIKYTTAYDSEGQETAFNEGVADTSKLFIRNAVVGDYYIIAGETALVSSTMTTDLLWDDDSIVLSDILEVDKTEVVTDATNSYFRVTTKSKQGGDIPAYIDKNVAPAAYRAVLADENSEAFKYVSAVGELLSETDKISLLNRNANMPEELGVMHNHFNVTNISSDAVAKHLALDEHTQGREIWAQAIHNKENVSGLGLNAQGNSYDTQYNGAIVGVDIMDNGKTTLGAALTYIDGKATAAGSHNEGKYYGVTLYGRSKVAENTGLQYDVSYTHSKNELDMYSGCNYGQITGDQKVNSFSVGARLEQELRVGKSSSFVPHIGARWLRMKAGSFTNSLGNSYNPDVTNSFILPLGLSFKAGMENSGWKMSFLADAGYQWNAGNRDYTQHFSYNGAGNAFDVNFADRGNWYAGAGFEFNKKNFTAGVSYRYAKGESTRQNKWNVNLSWSF